MTSAALTWFTFSVYQPPSDDSEEGYEYNEEWYGVTLEDAKEKYRADNPDMIVLSGGKPVNSQEST